MQKNLLAEIKNAVGAIRAQKPLILNLTNVVTMDFMANALLALGSAPLMSVADDEMPELVTISAAVNINIGTLDAAFVARAITAARLAAGKIPVVLDPVGAGASALRTTSAAKIFNLANMVRGNGSEIMALGNELGNHLGNELGNHLVGMAGDGKESPQSRGVESTIAALDAKTTAINLAKPNKKIIIVSGKEDVITDGSAVATCGFGAALMTSVTGMGCVLTAVVAAFASVANKGNNKPDYFQSAILATNFFALVGQVAAMTEKNPGGFKTAFIDGLHTPDWQRMAEIIDAA
ncbi:MAG: hydroxyethylthiazole kinase [Hydrotalea sp.]|nr:hydroxyethylthiazole kinase [Hydrotalea sp.]